MGLYGGKKTLERIQKTHDRCDKMSEIEFMEFLDELGYPIPQMVVEWFSTPNESLKGLRAETQYTIDSLSEKLKGVLPIKRTDPPYSDMVRQSQELKQVNFVCDKIINRAYYAHLRKEKAVHH